MGDIFPREGITVTEKRLAELAGSDNKQGVPLIELVEETVEAEVMGCQQATDDTEPVAKKPSSRKPSAKKTEPSK